MTNYRKPVGVGLSLHTLNYTFNKAFYCYQDGFDYKHLQSNTYRHNEKESGL